MKKVAALYRVSTKGQLDGNDIPLQQRACRGMIDSKDDWTLVKEYVEKGVSGFKVSEKNRDAIQRAKEDAEKGLFDILLVFMFDRLGRKDDETPFVVEWFVKAGIEVWSVVEGQQKIEEHTDRLINYIRFWQSSGESRKTSERVDEKHSQMVEDGIFRGGGVAYGYTTVESGIVNKKGKSLLKMIVDPVESEVVKKIYDLALNHGYGQLRIAQYLNDNNIPAKKTSKWGSPTINAILKNPIYKGVMRYRSHKREKFSPPQKELIIITPHIWDSVQLMREKKNPKNYTNNDESNVPMSTKSSALFIGMARCGCCNSRMTTTVFVNKYKKASGEVVKYNSAPSYRCSGKLQGKRNCNGQSTFSSTRIDGVILDYVFDFLDNLKKIDFEKDLENYRKKNVYSDEKELKQFQSNLETGYKELSALTSEVPNAIMGKSPFNTELLSKLIEDKNKEISLLLEKIELKESELKKKKVSEKDIVELIEYIAVWREEFQKAPIERKKIMLSSIIENVYIKKENVRVEFKIHLQEFDEGLYSETNYGGRALHVITHVKFIFQESLMIRHKDKKRTVAN